MKSLVGFVWFVGLILLQAANAVNNFTNPGPAGNTVIQAGGGATTCSLTLKDLSYRITWAADKSQPLISLILVHGEQQIVLFNQQPNAGYYIWTPPENLPSGTYTFVIGTGPPDDLSGESTSATFVIQPCSTCYSVASTVLFTPEQTTASETETSTKTSSSSKTESALATSTQSSISEEASTTLTSLASGTTATTPSTSSTTTPRGTATATQSRVSAVSVTATEGSHSTITVAEGSIGTSTTVQPLPSLGPTISSSGTSSASSLAGKVECGNERWIGIVAGMMVWWIVPMMI